MKQQGRKPMGTATTESKAVPARPSLYLLLVLALVLAGISAGPDQAAAKSISGTIAVSVRVLPAAKLSNLRQPENLVISDSDIRRGFVEVVNGSLVEIKNNNVNGCYLIVENNFPYEWASLNIQERSVMLSEEGGIIHLSSFGDNVAPIHYVVGLKPGTKPGVYPWPFRLAVSTIRPY